MHFILAGGSGFVGLQLCSDLLLEQHQVTVLTHSEPQDTLALFSRKGLQDDVEILTYEEYQGQGDVLINLAGESLGAKPIMTRRLKLLLNSRLNVLESLSALPSLPPVFMQASAVAVYPDDHAEQDESSEVKNTNEIAQMALAVEDAAKKLQEKFQFKRFYLLRFGLILDACGGFMRKLRKVPPFTVLHGNNYIPFISLDDTSAAILFLAAADCTVPSGPVNFVAPVYANLKAVLHCCYKYSRIPPVPILTGLLKLGDKRIQVLRADVSLKPHVLLEAGFTFHDERIEQID